MKRFVLFLEIILIFIIFYLYKQVHASGIPQLINYSGNLMDQKGEPLNGKYTLSFKIYTSSKNGSLLWGPKTKYIDVNNGKFNVILDIDDNNNPIANVFLLNATTYLEIDVDGKVIPPRQQIISVPYAFVADTVYGSVNTMDGGGNKRVSADVLSSGKCLIKTLGTSGGDNVVISSEGSVAVGDTIANKAVMSVFPNGLGSIYVADNKGVAKVNINGHGYIQTLGTNGNKIVSIGPETVNVCDEAGNPKAFFSGDGYIQLLGPSGEINRLNVEIYGWSRGGNITVGGKNTDNECRMTIDSNNKGIISGNVNNMHVANPIQKGTEIWYACIEGPEAAVYIRGVARLVNGKASVKLPGHFVVISNQKGITVELTPLSSDSKGLAVVDTEIDGFTVRELFNGTGTYDFDYLAMAVRKGYKNYKVIRPVSNSADLKNKDMKIQ